MTSDNDSELVEKVARAIFNRLDTEGRSHWEDQSISTQISIRDAARAAIVVCMEEAAAKAERYVIDPHDECFGVAEGIADSIRALSPKVR